MAKPSLGEWEVEGLRLSAFLVEPIPAEVGFWQSLVGSPPEEVYTQPRQHTIRETGPLLNGRLQVDTSINRIDWKLFQASDTPSGELPIPTVGSYGATGDEFRTLMQKWLADCPPLHRLGYGGLLLLPASSLPDACKKLDDLLPAVDVDPKNTLDFVYRINSRRRSRLDIEGLEINRLATWSAAQIIATHVDLTTSGQQAPKVTQLPDARCICRLELDINTAPEFDRKFEKDFLLKIFDELVDIGNEIATQGYIA